MTAPYLRQMGQEISTSRTQGQLARLRNTHFIDHSDRM